MLNFTSIMASPLDPTNIKDDAFELEVKKIDIRSEKPC